MTTPTATDREIAGLRCSEVLALLSSWVDGELTGAQRGAVEGHVRGCDVCERFGGRFAAMVQAIRALASDDDVAPASLEQLRQRLRAP
ncbi:MAG: zf-HC2 domain-containing protein [Nannocystaceae bacterium]|nr:zf-HC2 domain-containing protein [Nannocystaceae bacterium]